MILLTGIGLWGAFTLLLVGLGVGFAAGLYADDLNEATKSLKKKSQNNEPKGKF